MFKWTVSPEEAPDRAEYVEVGFVEGRPSSVNGEELGAVALLEALNEIGSRHGVGRADVVEDRLVGMKSRGVYETPGGTLLYTALQELEQICLDRRALALKDQLAPRWADLVYEGRWWTPEREALEALVDSLMRPVTGAVKLKLYKGGAWAVSRTSPNTLYREDLATFGASAYDHADATGFIRLFALPIRAQAARDALSSADSSAGSDDETTGASAAGAESGEPVGARSS
jgi:argininosuccinate synthase